MTVSIVIRAKNEERWIAQCLQRVREQTVRDVEVILVDNLSTDKTVERASNAYPEIKLVTVEEYRPGKALNEGIRASSGEHIVCLSAHCLPVNDTWLANLQRNLADTSVAGVYGRQIPARFSHPIDKRDLLITFGLDRRVQKRDTFFHNANSMIPRAIWERYPFDEDVVNIEDRIWAKQVIEAGYTLVYEPEAPVYHAHGIHQTNDPNRYDNVVRIMESLELQPADERTNPLDPAKLEIAAIIPLRQQGGSGIDHHDPLIQETIDAARQAQYINRVILSTDSEDMVQKAAELGAEAPFVRPQRLSEDHIRVNEVLQYSLEQLEQQGYYPDLVVPLEITYPFRPPDLLDSMIAKLIDNGLDTVIAAFSEYRPCWRREEGRLGRIDDHATPRDQREPLRIGLISLGCVTYSEFIRQGTRLGGELGIYEIGDPLATIEIRESADLPLFEQIKNVIRVRTT